MPRLKKAPGPEVSDHSRAGFKKISMLNKLKNHRLDTQGPDGALDLIYQYLFRPFPVKPRHASRRM